MFFPTDCTTFIEKFTEIVESQGSKDENKDATTAARLLEKLSVADIKTEGKAPVAAEEKESTSESAEAEKKDILSA